MFNLDNQRINKQTTHFVNKLKKIIIIIKIKTFDLPATSETATSTSPRPPGPFMYSLSVFPGE